MLRRTAFERVVDHFWRRQSVPRAGKQERPHSRLGLAAGPHDCTPKIGTGHRMRRYELLTDGRTG